MGSAGRNYTNSRQKFEHIRLKLNTCIECIYGTCYVFITCVGKVLL